MKSIILLSLLFTVQTVMAETTQREHGAHVHGHASLNLAWSGNELVIEIESPAMNLLGFEHAASSDADKQRLSDTLKALRAPESIIMPNPQAQCQLHGVQVDSALLQGPTDDDHADFTISINYLCGSLQKLQSLDLSGLFKRFSGLVDLDVQWVSDSRQSATELNPQHPLLLLE